MHFPSYSMSYLNLPPWSIHRYTNYIIMLYKFNIISWVNLYVLYPSNCQGKKLIPHPPEVNRFIWTYSSCLNLLESYKNLYNARGPSNDASGGQKLSQIKG